MADVVQRVEASSSSPSPPAMPKRIRVRFFSSALNRRRAEETAVADVVQRVEAKEEVASSSSSSPSPPAIPKRIRVRFFCSGLNRQRAEESRRLLRDEKLVLVLDLDHTLLHSIAISDLSPEEEHLLTYGAARPSGLYWLESIEKLTKLRPVVRHFLDSASALFQLYIYTKGGRRYAQEMAKILDPDGGYFDHGKRVFSRKDCTREGQKSLEDVGADESMVVVLDDTQPVWRSCDQKNLMVVPSYHYFTHSRCAHKSLCELGTDERESGAPLARALVTLHHVHRLFFSGKSTRDVSHILKEIRLAGSAPST